jgi:hypothetical protein
MMELGNLSFDIELKKAPELNSFNTKYPNIKMTVKKTSFKTVIPAESRKITMISSRIKR